MNIVSRKISSTSKFWGALVALVALVALSFPGASYAAKARPGSESSSLLVVEAKSFPTLSSISDAAVAAIGIDGNVYEGTTNKDGRTNLSLPEGDYMVRVTAAQHEDWVGKALVLSTHINYVQATLTVSVPPMSDPPVASDPPVGNVNAISVHVFSSMQGNISGADVTVYDQDGMKVAMETTGETGAVNLAVPDGTYLVAVSADKYETWTRQIALPGITPTHIEAALQPVTSGAPPPVPPGGNPDPSDPSDPAAPPVPPAVEAGKLVLTIVDTTANAPVAGAAVMVWNADNQLVFKGVTPPRSSIATELPAGLYSFSVEAKGYQGYAGDLVIVANETTEQFIELKPLSPPNQ